MYTYVIGLCVFVSHFLSLLICLSCPFGLSCGYVITIFGEMEDKEGSGIEKYTESPVTSRSTILEKDMTSVYVSYILYIYS